MQTAIRPIADIYHVFGLFAMSSLILGFARVTLGKVTPNAELDKKLANNF